MCVHRYADEIRSEDEAADAARGVSKTKASKAPSVASPVPQKLEIAVEDVPTVQISGLDREQIVPPSPSQTPQTPDSFGHSFGLDEEELRRGMADEDEDSGSETPQAQVEPNLSVTAEEGVPPSGAASGVPAAVTSDEEDWDDV